MRSFLPSLALGVCLGGALGCQVPPAQVPPRLTEALPAAGFDPGTIRDVAVLPIEVAQDVTGVPQLAVRRALQRELVERLYSPLSLEYVDGRWSEAGWSPAADGREALLRVEVVRWDTRALASHGAIVALVDARLHPAAGLDAAPLWGYRLERRIEVPRSTVDRGGPSAIDAAAARRLAELILAELPERDPLGDRGTPDGTPEPATD